MTILQASYEFGTKIYTTSVGESLTSVVVSIYKSYADIYYQVLQTLNNRFDWDNLPVGVEIRYLEKEACEYCYELTD